MSCTNRLLPCSSVFSLFIGAVTLLSASKSFDVPAFLLTKLKNLCFQVPNASKNFAQTEPSDSCVVASVAMFRIVLLQECNKLSFSALDLIELTILVTSSAVWFSCSIDLHKTSWWIIQCKNISFCSEFTAVHSAVHLHSLYKSNSFLLLDWDRLQLGLRSVCPIPTQGCPNMHHEEVSPRRRPFHWPHCCYLLCDCKVLGYPTYKSSWAMSRNSQLSTYVKTKKVSTVHSPLHLL